MYPEPSPFLTSLPQHSPFSRRFQQHSPFLTSLPAARGLMTIRVFVQRAALTITVLAALLDTRVQTDNDVPGNSGKERRPDLHSLALRDIPRVTLTLGS